MKLLFRWKRTLVVFLVISLQNKSWNNLCVSARCCWIFCGSYRIISIGSKRSLEKTFQKKPIVPLKILLAHFFSKYRLRQASSTYLGSTVFLCLCGACYEICSLTPRIFLKKQTFEIKRLFHWKNFWVNFLVISLRRK